MVLNLVSDNTCSWNSLHNYSYTARVVQIQVYTMDTNYTPSNNLSLSRYAEHEPPCVRLLVQDMWITFMVDHDLTTMRWGRQVMCEYRAYYNGKIEG